MTTEILKPATRLDGFTSYEDGVEGNPDHAPSTGLIQGTLVKFSNEAKWTARDGDELPADLELVAIDVVRLVQQWVDQQPVETIIVAPNEKFPSLEKLNDAAPRSEWSEDLNGRPRGPWQAQRLLYLLDLATMDKLTFATGTIGGTIAIRDLVDKIRWMRRYRGQDVYAAVTLSNVFMNTRFGGRQRPHFVIKRWVRLGDSGVPLPAAEQPALTGSTVKLPTLSEEMADKVTY